MTVQLRLIDSLRLAIWTGAAVLLALPALTMRLAPQAGVNWSLADFGVMAAMLATACGAVEFGLRRAPNLPYVAGVVLAVGTTFATVWANLAVGMIGDPGNPKNALFLGVLAVAGVGALLARFRARGLARTCGLAGLAQAVIAAMVFIGGWDAPVVAALIGAFALPWWMSAVLFQRGA